MSTVQEEFKQDPIYLAKVMKLGSKYSNVRRTRPDGNCFFRAVAFAYFEKVRMCSVIFLGDALMSMLGAKLLTMCIIVV